MKTTFKISSIAIGMFLIASLAPTAIYAESGYKLIKKTTIGGEGGWDYLSVDSQNRRIYVSHGNQVEVLNADSHEKIGVISDLHGVHGIVAVPKAGRGVITNGRTNTATLFDLT